MNSNIFDEAEDNGLDARTKESAAQTRSKIRDIFSGHPRIPASIKSDEATIALARSIAERDDFNLRLPGDHFFWANAAKDMAKAILKAAGDDSVRSN